MSWNLRNLGFAILNLPFLILMLAVLLALQASRARLHRQA